MGSRVRIAAAACLVASGLLAGGACASMAFADPGDSGNAHGSADKPKSHPDGKNTPPGDRSGNGDNNNGHNGVGNPNNGNCGNSGANGNAQGCGGGHDNGDPDDPTPTTKPTPSPTPTTKPTTPTMRPSTPPTKDEPPPAPDEPGGCDEDSNDDCSPGWPGLPWPGGPGQSPASGGGGGRGAPEVPSGRLQMPPQMQLPPELMPHATEPVEPTVIDAAPGVGVAAAEFPITPITLPIVVVPATGLGGVGSGGAPGAPWLPGAPRGVTAEPPTGREPLPANVGSNVARAATSYRTGYTEYLRSAGLPQVAALAGPGVAGMLVLTGAGGWVGYRQAKAGHAVHTSGTARFVK